MGIIIILMLEKLDQIMIMDHDTIMRKKIMHIMLHPPTMVHLHTIMGNDTIMKKKKIMVHDKYYHLYIVIHAIVLQLIPLIMNYKCKIINEDRIYIRIVIK